MRSTVITMHNIFKTSGKCYCLHKKLSEQTEFVSKEIYTELLRSFAKLEQHSISLEIALQECQEQLKNDTVCKEKASNVFRKEREQYFEIQDLKAQLQDKNIAIRVAHKTNVSRPQPRSNQMKDKYNSNHDACVSKFLKDVNARTKKPNVVPISTKKTKSQANKSVATPNKTTVASESTITSSKSYYRMLHKKTSKLKSNRGSDLYTISLQETTLSTPICLMAKASLTQAWLWHQRLSHLNFDYINLLSKKDVVIGLPKMKYVKDQLCSSCKVSKAKRSSFKTKTVPSSKGRLNLLHMDLCGPMRVASINGKKYILIKEKGDLCILVGYSTQSKGYRVYNKRTRLIVESIHLKFDEIKEMSETSVANDTSGLVLQRQKASDYDNSNPSSSPTDNFAQQDTHPSTNIQHTSEPSTPTNVHAEENNDNQAEDTEHEFTNPFCIPVQEVSESSSRNIGYSNLHTFNQPQDSEY
ncbi:retrovirus-related pol polyprotein from transposon TNT 1-94 [Tanacetum coccineum]